MLKKLTHFDDLKGPMKLEALADPLLLVNNTFRLPLLFKGMNQKKASEQGKTMPFFLFCAVKARMLSNDKRKAETPGDTSPYEIKTREAIRDLLKQVYNLIDGEGLDRRDFAISRTIQSKMLDFVLYNDEMTVETIDDIDTGEDKARPFASPDHPSFTIAPYLVFEVNEVSDGSLVAKCTEFALEAKEELEGKDMALLKEYTTFSRQVQNIAMLYLIKEEAPELLDVNMHMVPTKKANKERVRKYSADRAARMKTEAEKEGNALAS